jgi:hypothetical protein
MKRFVGLCLGLVVLALGLFAGTTSDASDFKRAPDGCKNAHAILGWSNFEGEKHMEIWRIAGFVMYSRPHWKVVDDHEPGVSQQASFRQYGVKGRDDATAYVANCGHGATCNAIAAAFFKAYRRVGKPRVYCGALPGLLEGEKRVKVYRPSDDELKEWREGGEGGDEDLDDDDFGDDDDDDDDEDE